MTEPLPGLDPEIVKRKAEVKNTHCCPYCEAPLAECDISNSPMADWGAALLFVCFNDECSYYKESFAVLAAQGASGGAYRLVYDPERDRCLPMASRHVGGAGRANG